MAEFERQLRYEAKQAEYRNNLLTNVIEKEKKLGNLAQEKITQLEGEVIAQIRNQEEVRRETKEKLNQVMDILSIQATEKGMNLLLECRRDLRNAVGPSWPYNFPQEIEVIDAFKQYRDGLDAAIGWNTVKWGTFFKEEMKDTYRKNVSERLKYIKGQIDNLKGSFSKKTN
jgi:hypothetical protein